MIRSISLSDKQQEVDLHSLRSQQEESLDQSTPTGGAGAEAASSGVSSAAATSSSGSGPADNKSQQQMAPHAAIGNSKPSGPTVGSESGVAGTDEMNATLPLSPSFCHISAQRIQDCPS